MGGVGRTKNRIDASDGNNKMPLSLSLSSSRSNRLGDGGGRTDCLLFLSSFMCVSSSQNFCSPPSLHNLFLHHRSSIEAKFFNIYQFKNKNYKSEIRYSTLLLICIAHKSRIHAMTVPLARMRSLSSLLYHLWALKMTTAMARVDFG